MSLPIVEVFLGLQGEGSRMGVPSIFVRLGGCNLSCQGFGCKIKSPIDGTELTGCDTIRAVNAKHFKNTWDYYDNYYDLVDKITQNIKTFDAHDNAEPVDIIFTGGEPMLHHTDPVLINTIEYFYSRGHKICFESNGTIAVDFEKYNIYKNVTFCMSVKMSASGESKEKRWKPEVVNSYLKNTKDSFFKFVLSKESIENEANEVLEFLKQVPTFGVVYCMPLGGVEKDIKLNSQAVYEFALRHNFRYSDRIHIRIYNDREGV